MYNYLNDINRRPQPFEFYTTDVLWNDPHISKSMLEVHLDPDDDRASRNKAFIERSLAWIIERFAIGEGTRVCDFGCGPGLYTLPLALKGASVTGLDFSERSLAYARNAAAENNVHIDYVLTNYLEYETDEQFDLITMIYCDFCVLSPEQRKVILRKFRRMLKDGGKILFDVHSWNLFDRKQKSTSYEHNPSGNFWSAADHYVFINFFKYEDEKVLLDKYTIIEADHTWEIYNWLQYFTPETLAAELDACGLTLTETLADVAGTPFSEDGDEFAVIVEKKPGKA